MSADNSYSVFTTSSEEKLDWKAALRLACKPLIAAGLLPDDYAAALIASVDKYGPHFLLAPGTALPCLAEGFIPATAPAVSVLRTQAPVVFDPDDSSCYADLFVVAVAPTVEEVRRLQAENWE